MAVHLNGNELFCFNQNTMQSKQKMCSHLVVLQGVLIALLHSVQMYTKFIFLSIFFNFLFIFESGLIPFELQM